MIEGCRVSRRCGGGVVIEGEERNLGEERMISNGNMGRRVIKEAEGLIGEDKQEGIVGQHSPDLWGMLDDTLFRGDMGRGGGIAGEGDLVGKEIGRSGVWRERDVDEWKRGYAEKEH